MNGAPRVSILIGVYNGGNAVEPTVQSLLNQSFSDFELIIVDDGSSDQTAAVLKSLAATDSRIVILSQANAGLTRALIAGSLQARGEFIARADIGDQSHPRRIEEQVEFLDAHPEVAALGTGLRRVGPGGELLGVACRSMTPEKVTREFLENGVGLSHPSSMFRTESFRAVGGYRAQFRYAQDTDLWFRISTAGLIAELPEPLLDLAVDTHGISANNREVQATLAYLARDSYDALASGESDSDILARAERVSAEKKSSTARQKRRQRADAEYFIGSQLLDQGDGRCRPYLWRAILRYPLWPRAWAKILSTLFLAKSPAVRPSPTWLTSTLDRCCRTSRLAGTRLKALAYRIRGARIGPKVGLGARVKIDYPWCVNIGRRANLESDVWLKVVDRNATLSIGQFSFVGRGTEFDVAQAVSVGSNVLIAPKVFVTDHTHNVASDQLIREQGCDCTPTTIEDDVWIGTGAVILAGVTIGRGAIIGAGAIVRCNVPSNEIWAGVPARKIRDRKLQPAC